MFVFSISLFILICWFFLYLYLSKKENSYVNILTPSLLVIVPTYFVFEMLHILLISGDENPVTYIYIYMSYFFMFFFLVLGYIGVRKKKYNSPLEQCFFNNNKHYRYLWLSLVFFVAGLAVYLPVLIEYSAYLLNPRYIYEKTRTGYGLYFFISLMFTQLSIVLGFYIKKWWFHLTLTPFNVILLVLHGNKTPILAMIMAYLLYRVYVLKKSLSFKFIFSVVAFVSVIMSLFFYLTFSGDENFLVKMASYSDYTRNSAMVIDSDYESRNGVLMLEAQLYSRIPRVVYPDKTLDFGYYRLVKNFYPSRFNNNEGMPSFGYGEFYADFGVLTIFVVSFLFFLKGMLIGFFRNKLMLDCSVYYFLPFIFLCGIDLIPLGTGWLFFEHIFLALILFLFIKIKVPNVRKLK